MDPTSQRRAANDWLKEFGVSLKSVSLYSTDHPRGKESLTRSFEKLQALLEGKLVVTLARADGRLTFENTALERDRAIATKLYDDLDERAVQTIEFSAGLSSEDYTAFIKCLLLKADRIHDKGGLDQVLLDEGVGTITVNKSRMGKVSDAVDLLTDLSLMDLLAGRTGTLGGDSLGELMEKNPGGLAQAMAQSAARKDTSPAPGDLAYQSEQVADSLERMAVRAAEEGSRDKGELSGDLGQILASVPAALQSRIIRDLTGPRAQREHLRSAIENMTPDTLAQVVTTQYDQSKGEYEALHELLMRTASWKNDRESTLKAVGGRLRGGGTSEEESKEILDHLMWAELDLTRRFQLLNQGDTLWKVDFQRVKEVLVKLFGTDQIKDATALIQKYLSGLIQEEAEIRRSVAENARYILQLIEKTRKGLPMLVRIGSLFMTRVQDESDPEVHARLSAALGFLADLRLRNGELEPVLELMRKADELASSNDAATQLKGKRLGEALNRVGNEKLFKELVDQHLAGTDKPSLQAAEVLSRSGSRAINYLIDRLADEEDRGNRARIVSLLKEMEKADSDTFTSRLSDPRWFLVRNVVHILGEVGSPTVLPELKEVGKHSDPRVRKELIRAYLRIGSPECEDLIIATLADADRSVRVAAIHALSVLKGRRAPGIILEIIQKKGAYANVDAEVRQESVNAAGRMAVEPAVASLIGIISKKGLLGYAESVELRLAAAQALGAIATTEALESLRNIALGDSKAEVRDAAEAILIAREG
jgi:HEAT repeat protein